MFYDPQIFLKKYFKREDEQMENQMEEIEEMFQNLPKDQDMQKVCLLFTSGVRALLLHL